jgi:hypothetical protein
MSNTILRRSLNNVFDGGVATSAMDTLATGPFLIAYALMFGAGNIAIGFLGAIGFVGNLMHLLSAYLIEQGKSPKQISVLFSAVSRPFYLIAALLAFGAGSIWALIFLIVCFSATYMIGSVAGGAWLPWMKALVPEKLMGRFFSHRFKWMMIAKIVCYGSGASLIWYFEKYQPQSTIFAYSILLVVAFIISLYTIIKTKKENKKPKSKIYEMLENKEFDKVKYTLLESEYVVQNIGDEYFIYLENSFDFVATKEEFQLLVTVYKDKVSLDIDLNDNELETMDEEYFNNQIESLTVLPLTENSNVEDVIKMMDNMINIFGEELLQLRDKYKK